VSFTEKRLNNLCPELSSLNVKSEFAPEAPLYLPLRLIFSRENLSYYVDSERFRPKLFNVSIYWWIVLFTAMISSILISYLLILIVIVYSYAIKFYLKNLEKLVQAEFEKDYPTLLISLSAMIKSGSDPLLALRKAGELFAAERVIVSELKRIDAALDRGEAMALAIKHFGSGVRQGDTKLFHTAFNLAVAEGSAFSPILLRLAKFVRQRQSFRRRSRAALAVQRLSSLGIIGCAVTMVIFQVATNKEALNLIYKNNLALMAFLSGITVLIFGAVLMFRLCSKEVE
jgi:Flp pilus assembly protein TadB